MNSFITFESLIITFSSRLLLLVGISPTSYKATVEGHPPITFANCFYVKFHFCRNALISSGLTKSNISQYLS